MKLQDGTAGAEQTKQPIIPDEQWSVSFRLYIPWNSQNNLGFIDGLEK